MSDRYHHGDLKRAVIERALEVISTHGPAALTLRSLAADIGVSHTAPLHHFGNLRGLLTAIAIEGFAELRTRLAAIRGSGGGFRDEGVGYVEFALDRPAHFAVMFQPALLDMEDSALTGAMTATFAALRSGAEQVSDPLAREDAAAAVIAGWSLVHGFAVLALSGNLAKAGVRELVGESDLLSLARRTTFMLYGSPEATQRNGETKPKDNRSSPGKGEQP